MSDGRGSFGGEERSLPGFLRIDKVLFICVLLLGVSFNKPSDTLP
jgi:hypothetical protein